MPMPRSQLLAAWATLEPPNLLREAQSERMPVIYINRKGWTYYLCQTVTKTGKPRYYFAREQKGEPIESTRVITNGRFPQL